VRKLAEKSAAADAEIAALRKQLAEAKKESGGSIAVINPAAAVSFAPTMASP